VCGEGDAALRPALPQGADIVVTMLADADVVLTAMEGKSGALATMPRSAIWIQMSTLGERGTQRCVTLAAHHGVRLVDAPVLGSRQPAEERKLVVLASGSARLRSRVQPVFDALSKRTEWVGEVGMGSRLKLVTNSWVLSVVEAGAEAIALANGLGLDSKLLLDAIEGGPLDLPYLRTKACAITRRNFAPSFKLALAAKDAALIDSAAEHRGMDLPLLHAVRSRLAEGAERYPEHDFSATYLTSAPH
jgi:3-hydroxyisobutyrate dehydrogenase